MSQIKLLLDIIADVRHLGDSLKAYAEALTASDKLNPDDFEQVYPHVEEQTEVVTTPEAESPKEITLSEVRAVLANKSIAGFTNEVKQLLMKHGAEKLSGIAETEYAALMKEAENLGS